MSDVLEGGGPRHPLPRAVWVAVAAVAVAAVLVAMAVANGGSHPAAAPSASASQTSTASPLSAVTATPAVTPTPSTPAVQAASWPTASGACGASAFLPISEFATQFETDPPAADTDLLVGGSRLWLVAASTPATVPTARAMPGLPADPDRFVSRLAEGPDATYAMVAPCGYGAAVEVYRVADDVARPVHLATQVDEMFGGAHHAWAVTFGRPPLERSGQVDVARELLTPLDGAPPITLAPASYLVADVAAGLVVGQNDPSDTDTPPSLELVDSATGAVVHALGAGYPLGAQGNSLLVQGGGCSASTTPAACTLVDIEVSTGKVTATVALPAGSVPTSDAVFSADGTRAALQITQAEPDPRFSTGHPFPPSEVVMVHLDTGVIGRVANMVIPPKTVLGLAFSSSGEALFITVGEGADSDLLVWQDTMVSPAFVTTLPGAVTGAPPIVRTSR